MEYIRKVNIFVIEIEELSIFIMYFTILVINDLSIFPKFYAIILGPRINPKIYALLKGYPKEVNHHLPIDACKFPLPRPAYSGKSLIMEVHYFLFGLHLKSNNFLGNLERERANY